MSFIHFEWIGHFDPKDPYECTRPIRPRPTRPLSPDAIEKRIAGAPIPIDHMVTVVDKSFVQFVWTREPRVNDDAIQWFVCGLADDEGAVVMNQRLEIWYPDSARVDFETHAEDIQLRHRML